MGRRSRRGDAPSAGIAGLAQRHGGRGHGRSTCSSRIHAVTSNAAGPPSRSGRESIGCTGSRWMFRIRRPTSTSRPCHPTLASADPVRTGRRRADQGRGSRRAGRPARSAVAPFVGARLRDWAARCLVSPYGYLYTRVSDWPHRPRCAPSTVTSLEVAEIGYDHTRSRRMSVARLLDWLDGTGARPGHRSPSRHPLQRIVFEDGDVVGAVFATPDGPLAVRARHGVTVASGRTAGRHGRGAALPGRRCDRCGCAWSAGPPAGSVASSC